MKGRNRAERTGEDRKGKGKERGRGRRKRKGTGEREGEGEEKRKEEEERREEEGGKEEEKRRRRKEKERGSDGEQETEKKEGREQNGRNRGLGRCEDYNYLFFPILISFFFFLPLLPFSSFFFFSLVSPFPSSYSGVEVLFFNIGALSEGEVQGRHSTSVSSRSKSLLCLGHLSLEIFVELA